MALENLVLYVASYDEAATAEADYKALKDAQHADDFAVVGAVVASRDEAGGGTPHPDRGASPGGGRPAAGPAGGRGGCRSRPRSVPASVPESAS